MGRRIISVTEIQNIVVLGLDLWVAPPVGVSTEAWCMTGPYLKQGLHGLMLGNTPNNAQYLPQWGIRDPNCTAVMYIHDSNEYRLYNDQQSAQNAINRRFAVYAHEPYP